MADLGRCKPEPIRPGVAISDLPSGEKAIRSGSFGQVASDYERYRPGPPSEAVDWILSSRRSQRIVDLGAGTGALTRLLVERADEVIAIEPDERMRAVLVEEVPLARAIAGRGESMPLPDSHVEAVIASSSWHWRDPVPTLLEAGRVIVPGGVLGAIWTGPDPEGALLAQASSILVGRFRSGETEVDGSYHQSGEEPDSELAQVMLGEADRPTLTLQVPPDVPFDQPEHEIFRWDVALSADDLIGLLGTVSWVITLADERRERVIAQARRVLREVSGIQGDATVDVAFRADAWRARRHI